MRNIEKRRQIHDTSRRKNVSQAAIQCRLAAEGLTRGRTDIAHEIVFIKILFTRINFVHNRTDLNKIFYYTICTVLLTITRRVQKQDEQHPNVQQNHVTEDNNSRHWVTSQKDPSPDANCVHGGICVFHTSCNSGI